MKNPIIRQGDVCLVPIADLPADVEDVTPKEGRVVLMHGESTGHAHAFYDRGVVLLQSKQEPRRRFLRIVETTALLRHEEHETAHVPPGLYELPQQVEYSPEELQRVAD